MFKCSLVAYNCVDLIMAESDDEKPTDGGQTETGDVDEKLFCVERDKTGRAKCKRCKNAIDRDSIRIAKLVTNPFGSGKMKAWHHLKCIFEAFKKQRKTTPKIENIDDIDGYDTLCEGDIEEILQFMSDGKNTTPTYERSSRILGNHRIVFSCSDARTHWNELKKQLPALPPPGTPIAKKKKGKKETPSTPSAVTASPLKVLDNTDPNHRDNSFRQFRKICIALTNETSHLAKTAIMKEFFTKGSDGG